MFENWVIQTLLATKNQTKTAGLMQCDFHVVNRIMHRACERGLMRREKNEEFKFVGIDEKKFKKGHDYVTVLSSQDKGIVIDLCQGRDFKSCKALINKCFSKDQIQKVRTISKDMWRSYISVYTNFFSKALLIHDRYHLVTYLNDAIDKVRKREVKTNEQLKNTKYIWLKNPCNLTEKQKEKFELINRANFQVSKAWQIKENFRMIFGNQYLEEAFDLFVNWLQDAYKSGIKEVVKVAQTFASHSIGVLNALFCNQSNSLAERMNGKIQEIKTCGRGYRTFTNFRSAVLFFNGGLDLFPQGSQ